MLNQESAVIHVNPYITHYTVYTIDASNGSTIDRVNVTETSFTPTNNIPMLCPMYQVSAWNAGGEGELSDPVQESTPQGVENTITRIFITFCVTVYSLLYLYS